MKIFHLLIAFLSFQTLVLSNEEFKIVATASMLADMTENITGNLMNVSMIVPIGGDPHLYEPTPEDARLIEDADLILMNGLNFEGWLTELINNSGTKANVVTVTEGVDVIQSSEYDNSADPHAWMDPVQGLKYVENIYKAIIELDPNNLDKYGFNYKMYSGQIKQTMDYCINRVQELPEHKRVLVTSHDAFKYYGQRFGLKLEAVQGTSTEADVQTKDITRVSKIIAESQIPAIFVESTINPKLLSTLAKDNNVVIGGKLYADSLGDEKSPASTYLDMIKYNTDTIVDALIKDAKPPKDISGGFNFRWLYFGLALLLVGLLFFKLVGRN